MRVDCLTSLDELTPYVDDWERLAAGSPFRGWSWLSNWWRNYGPRDQAETPRTRLATLCVFDDDRLVGIAPWYLDCSAMRGRVLRPLGSGKVCSEYLGILCQPGREAGVVGSLADFLLQSAFDDDRDGLRWDLIELDGVDAEDREISALVDHLRGSDCAVYRRPGMSCWRVELPGDWESYVASLGKYLRRDIRRFERNLFDMGRAVLHRVRQGDELTEAMNILVDLHQRRRAALGEEGCFASPRFLGFYHDVVPALFHRGQLDLCWLELDGRPAAAEFQLAGKGILYQYQSGMEPAAMEHRPGKVINAGILRQVIAEGYRAFDFLRGDEPYKTLFGAKPRPTVRFRVASPRRAARWRHSLWVVGRNAKDWLKTRLRDSGSLKPETQAVGE